MNAPILIKKWRVYNYSPGDLDWLKEQGYYFHIATNSIPIAQGNKVTYIRGDVGVSVDTSTESEELMLKLKFEPGLVMLLQEWVIPHGECTLSNIDWDRT